MGAFIDAPLSSTLPSQIPTQSLSELLPLEEDELSLTLTLSDALLPALLGLIFFAFLNACSVCSTGLRSGKKSLRLYGVAESDEPLPEAEFETTGRA